MFYQEEKKGVVKGCELDPNSLERSDVAHDFFQGAPKVGRKKNVVMLGIYVLSKELPILIIVKKTPFT